MRLMQAYAGERTNTSLFSYGLNELPLLCTTISLLFLRLALSCESQKRITDISAEFKFFIEDHIKELMTNIRADPRYIANCSREMKHKPANCSDATVVPIHRLTCKMQRLGLSETETLQGLVLNSLNCTCKQRQRRNTSTSTMPTSKRRRKERGERRHRLCKVTLLLEDIETCYHMLNSAPS